MLAKLCGQFIEFTMANNTAEGTDENMLISIGSVLLIVWERRYLVIGAAVLGAILAFGLAQSQTRIYRATATVAVVTDFSGVGGGLSSGLSGLASLAGIEIASGGDSMRQEQLAYLRSRLLIREFIQQQDLMKVIFRRNWDEENSHWRTTMWSHPPTLEDGVEYFTRKIRSVDEDRRSGLVAVQIEWTDPALASEWANSFVDLANHNIRALAASDARKSLDYLNEELAKTTVVESRQTISRLMATQLDRVMLASVRPQYAYRVLEPATRSDDRRYVSPQVGLQTGLGSVSGAVAGAFYALLRRRKALEEVAPAMQIST